MPNEGFFPSATTMRESPPARRALIADDDEFFRLALAAILTRRLGFENVVESGSLDEAVAQLEQHGAANPFALALFDLEMPGMAGAFSLAAVRECFPDVLVAVVSGSTRRRDILVALDAGAHGYLPKSLGATQLASALSTVLSGSIYVPRCLADIEGPGGPSIIEREHPAESVSSNARIDALPPALTRRQLEVLKLITVGKANKEIARDLGLGEGTVKVHVAALLRALEVGNRSAAAAIGARFINN